MINQLCADNDISKLRNYVQSLYRGIDEAADTHRVAVAVNKKDFSKYTPLHSAIFAKNLEAVEYLVEIGADASIKCHGTPSLHLALTSSLLPDCELFGESCFSLLLNTGIAIINQRDDQGYSALHVAVELNLVKSLSVFLSETKPQLSFLLGTGNNKMTALHRGAVKDSAESINLLLNYSVEFDEQSFLALLMARDEYDRTPLHLAAKYGSSKAWKIIISNLNKMIQKDNVESSVRKTCQVIISESIDLLGQSGWIPNNVDQSIIRPSHNPKEKGTALITSSTCHEHYTCNPNLVRHPSAPPENTRRLDVLVSSDLGVLCSSDIAQRMVWQIECQPAAMADILRVHEWNYIRQVQQRCDAVLDGVSEEANIAFLDGDTTISKGSFKAAVHSAGAVCEAVDKVMSGLVTNAFCPIRPPGHHAGPCGVVKVKSNGMTNSAGPDSHGFCILNNISIGAAYAMNRYRDKIKRVVLVDFDVHHGNGTEETVRWLRPHIEETYLNDKHHDDYSSFFGSIFTPKFKPWYDETDIHNVLFVSVHGYGPREKGLEHLFPQAAFYPGSGETKIPDIPTASWINNTTQNNVNVVHGNNEGSAIDHPDNTNNSMIVVDRNDEENDNVQNSYDGEDDDDDDEDDSNFNEDDDSDDDEAHSKNEQNDDEQAIQTKLNNLKGIFTTLGTEARTKLSAISESLAPLILDVGVPLPDNTDEDNASESPVKSDAIIILTKLINETSYRYQWRNYFRSYIFPRLLQFIPDIIFISAGFDAHKKDTINGGYIALVEDDFEWITNNLVAIANTCCEGRIISALEGGYQISGEFCSSFAKSVKIHVESLAQGSKCNHKFNVEESNKEKETEEKIISKMREKLEKLKANAAREAEQLLNAYRIGENLNEGISSPVTNAVVSPPIEAAIVDEQSKKRRRPQVDYAALDQKLKQQQETIEIGNIN
eukprot:gene6205-8545_t